MKGEDRRWSALKDGHDSPVVGGGWPGWTASGHDGPHLREVKTASGLPAKAMQMNLRLHRLLVSTRCPECFDYPNPRVVGKLRTYDIALVLKMILSKDEIMRCGPPRPVAGANQPLGSSRVKVLE
ncbi:hypothetical protein CDL15_Pgr005059 [Punica granatum]|uniref:Uncharacterized protein n=1 Tax=Punica granatum TaxID=22663 RepID=A0A218W3E9_PUNGR|nr:hypothetical protein CDL15_Pgr005059 [Punica granatum]